MQELAHDLAMLKGVIWKELDGTKRSFVVGQPGGTLLEQIPIHGADDLVTEVELTVRLRLVKPTPVQDLDHDLKACGLCLALRAAGNITQ